MITVSIQIPAVARGASLAEVKFNGTLYPNGSLLSGLIPGYNYTFFAVDIAPGYDFDQWAVSNGTIGNITSSTSIVSFGCFLVPCPTVNLSLTLASRNHSLFSGQAFHASAANSMNATFVVPIVSWWHNPWNLAIPSAGESEVVDWGVGLGGVLSGDSTLVVGLQINYSTTQRPFIYNTSNTPFWSTTIANTSGQTNFTISPVSIGDTIDVSVSCLTGPSISDATQHWYYNAGFSPNCNSGGKVFTTGEWMVWDPQGQPGKLAGNYTSGGGFLQNLVFDGGPVYPIVPSLWTPPCSPFVVTVTPCTPSYPAHVQFTQWIVDHTSSQSSGYWGEVLNPGSLYYPTSLPQPQHSAHFKPNVTNLASFIVSVFPIPTDPVNQSFLPQAVVNGKYYPNDAVGYLPQGDLASLGTIGNWTQNSSSLGFGRWGNSNISGPGLLLLNAAKENSNVSVDGPGYLELLPLMKGPSPFASLLQGPAISGYAVDPHDELELNAFPQGVNGTIIVPNVALNSSFKGSQQLMTASVGLFGNYSPSSGLNQSVLQTGIAVRGNWTPTRNISYEVWFRFVGSGGPVWNDSSFVVHPWNRLFLKAAEGVGGKNCPGVPTFIYVCWNVTNLNLSETWSGSTSVGDTGLTFRFSMWGVSNAFPRGVSVPRGWVASGPLPIFGQLEFVSHGLSAGSKVAPPYMFGPFLATSAYYDGDLSLSLRPSLVASPTIDGFIVAQS